jgi:hypothetical protein
MILFGMQCRVRLITGFSDPSTVRLSIYDSGGSVDVKLSGRSTPLSVYISQAEYITQGARPSMTTRSASSISYFGFGAKAQL